MRLPINIEELLSGRAVEGDRIEYKTGWNPDAIYRTVAISWWEFKKRMAMP